MKVAFNAFAGEKNYAVVKNALEQLSEFEKMSNTRVLGSGLLEGLNLEDIKRASERLTLQDGCISFFESITKNENISADVHVISYCWCKVLIKSAFSPGIFIADIGKESINKICTK